MNVLPKNERSGSVHAHHRKEARPIQLVRLLISVDHCVLLPTNSLFHANKTEVHLPQQDDNNELKKPSRRTRNLVAKKVLEPGKPIYWTRSLYFCD